MWGEQGFSSESAEIECTNLFSGLVTTKSSDHKRANIFGLLRWCEMVWPITGAKSYVCETGKSMKAVELALSQKDC
jgi:hypothetical protein